MREGERALWELVVNLDLLIDSTEAWLNSNEANGVDFIDVDIRI